MAKGKGRAAPSDALAAFQAEADAKRKAARLDRRRRMRAARPVYEDAGAVERKDPGGRLYMDRLSGFVSGGSCSGQ
jgi:hypothetical protein